MGKNRPRWWQAGSRLALGLVTASLLLVVTGVIAALVVVRVATLAAGAVGAMLVEVAAYVAFLATVAVTMLVLAALLILQTPLFALPFGPAARLGAVLVRAWLAGPGL